MRSRRIEWTREMLERVEAASGTVEHVQLAIEFGVKVSTIYSMRTKLREYGSVDEFLGPRVRSSGRRRGPTTERGTYNISHQEKSGRGRQSQYTVTIPISLAERFVARFGRRVRFEEQPDGSLLIVTAGNGRSAPGSAGTEPPETA